MFLPKFFPAPLGSSDLALKLIGLAARHLRPAQSSEQILGIVGFDEAACDLALRAHRGFGMQVLVQSATPVAKDVLALFDGVQVPFDELLFQADVVSLHSAPCAMRPVMTGARLDLMKPDAILISATDRALVDEDALAQSLMFDTIAGAAITMAPDQTLHPMLAQCDTLVTLPTHSSIPVLPRPRVA
ncbi:NAD(P)-dependent oxidoreductase [Gymnodinialimonas sp.]